jgi:DNA-directed RNA polymerase specialized sigma24 family protein
MATTQNRGKNPNTRNIGIKIWVNAEEEKTILGSAGDTAVSSWLRGIATGKACDDTIRKRGRITEDKGAFAPLVISMAMVGNNLSQIAEQLKGRDLTPELVTSISDELAQIRRELHLVVENILPRG